MVLVFVGCPVIKTILALPLCRKLMRVFPWSREHYKNGALKFTCNSCMLKVLQVRRPAQSGKFFVCDDYMRFFHVTCRILPTGKLCIFHYDTCWNHHWTLTVNAELRLKKNNNRDVLSNQSLPVVSLMSFSSLHASLEILNFVNGEKEKKVYHT